MDRVGGADLILPWPDGLPAGSPLAYDEERDATAAEHTIAESIVGAACRRAGLVPVRSMVAMLRCPTGTPRSGIVEQRLIVCIIGSRWVHATGHPRPGICWATIERIERL
jgi:hypothetical protein